MIYKYHIDISTSVAYYNSNRTPLTSHASDVSHGETFFIRKRVNLILKEAKIFGEQLTMIKGKEFIIPEESETLIKKKEMHKISYFIDTATQTDKKLRMKIGLVSFNKKTLRKKIA